MAEPGVDPCEDGPGHAVLSLGAGDEGLVVGLRLAVTGRAEWQIAATGRVGTSGKGSLQIDFTYPMDRILLRTFDAFLYAQYFDGWSESLLSYDQRLPWQLRIGIAVVR